MRKVQAGVGGWRGQWGEVGTLWPRGPACSTDRHKAFTPCEIPANRRASSSSRRSITGGGDFDRSVYHNRDDFGTATYQGWTVFVML
jgi:hypothetical protein